MLRWFKSRHRVKRIVRHPFCRLNFDQLENRSHASDVMLGAAVTSMLALPELDALADQTVTADVPASESAEPTTATFLATAGGSLQEPLSFDTSALASDSAENGKSGEWSTDTAASQAVISPEVWNTLGTTELEDILSSTPETAPGTWGLQGSSAVPSSAEYSAAPAPATANVSSAPMTASGARSYSDDVFDDIPAPPDAVDDEFTTDEDTPAIIDVLANDSDPNGDPLMAATVIPPTNGILLPNTDKTFTYVPTPNWHGTDSFAYLLSDGNGGFDTATAYVTTISINDAPVANDDSFTISEDSSLSYDILANDSDVDADTISVVELTDAQHGLVTLNDNQTVTYTPDGDWHGTDQFTYTIWDGIDAADTATVSITVEPVQDAPIAYDDFFQFSFCGSCMAWPPFDSANYAYEYQPLYNDIDYDFPNNTYNGGLKASLVEQPDYGTVQLRENGTFIYTWDGQFNGITSFAYQVTDSSGPNGLTGLQSNVAEVYLFVKSSGSNPPEGSPVGDDYFVAGDPISGNVLLNDPNASYAFLWRAPTKGRLALDSSGSGGFTYTPPQGRWVINPVSFSYMAVNGVGGSGRMTGGWRTLAQARLIKPVANLIMDGVPDDKAEEMPGGLVVINADNDNMSEVTNGIPATRDYEVSPVPAENDLKRVTVQLALPAGIEKANVPGFFVLGVTNKGTGRVKLWADATKQAPVTLGAFTAMQLPEQFYVEGTEPSDQLGDCRVTLVYVNLPGALGSSIDTIWTAVEPVVRQLAIIKPNPPKLRTDAEVNGVRFANGRDGLAGMGARQSRLDGRALTRGIGGGALFVQNMLGIDNGQVGNTGGGYTYVNAGPRNVVAPMNTSFPMLDKTANTDQPPDYDYSFLPETTFDVPAKGVDTRVIKAIDAPTTFGGRNAQNQVIIAPPNAASLQGIDLQYRFTLHMIWRFPQERGTRILYPLAKINWKVVFLADTHVADRGVTKIRNQSGVFPDANYTVDHAPPAKLTAPIANFTVIVQ